MNLRLTQAAPWAGLLILTLFCNLAHAQNPRVWLDTDRGSIVLELDSGNAPITVDNFLAYVNEGYYDGLVFHRVLEDFVIQAGRFDRDLRARENNRPTISSETSNGLSNQAGTIAMALLAGDINSATSQFYINLADNFALDEQFTVFGEVVLGMDTVEAIGAVRTATTFPDAVNATRAENAPVSPPLIRRAVEVEPDSFPLMPLHSASWFDVNNTGVGFNVEVTNNASSEEGPLLVVYWYDFKPGEQTWFYGLAGFDYGASEVTLDLLTTDGTGNDFQNPPPENQYTVVGTLTVRFNDCATGLFSFDLSSIGLGAGDIDVNRLTIPDQRSCEGL